jgi:hypothetical protein
MMGENKIPKKLVEYLELLSSNSKYLLSFSPFFVNHFSAHLMSYMINEKKDRILYICIGRPHIFIQKLLQNRGVPIRTIHFMDMVLGISSRGSGNEAPEITSPNDDGFLEMPMHYKLFKVDQEERSLSLDDVDLVILDNITELRTYNNDDGVRSLLELLNSIWDKAGKGLMVLHINNRPDDGIDRLSKEIGLELVKIPNDVFS